MARVLRCARARGCRHNRCWALLRGGMNPEDVLLEEEAMLQSMRADFQSLERVQVAKLGSTHATLAFRSSLPMGSLGCHSRGQRQGGAAER